MDTGKFKQKVATSAKDVRDIVRANNFVVDLRVPWRASVQIGTRPSARPIAVIFEAIHLKEKINVPTSIHQSHGSMAGVSITACPVLTAGTTGFSEPEQVTQHKLRRLIEGFVCNPLFGIVLILPKLPPRLLTIAGQQR